MSNAISDTAKQSRKGRKPINGRAMTAAERKQRQRQATEIKRQEMPSWLKLRHDIWQLVQDRFMFSTTAELADAMHAVAFAINICCFHAAGKHSGSHRYVSTMLGTSEPDEITKQCFPELLSYKPDQKLEDKYPGVHGMMLLDALRDMLGESQN